MKRRRRAAPRDFPPHTPQGGLSRPRGLKVMPTSRIPACPLPWGPGSLWGWEEHFEMAALRQPRCGNRSPGADSPSLGPAQHSKLGEGGERT